MNKDTFEALKIILGLAKKAKKNKIKFISRLETIAIIQIEKWIKQAEKDYEEKGEKIVVPVYYTLIKGKKVIDTDSIRKEFENDLKKALKNINKGRKK